jgi:ribonucleoside-triphosphate reductase
VKAFRLTENFLAKYQDIVPPFGFNGFGELVYYRTYSRIKEDGTNEVWWETVKRVVEGTYNMQKRHITESRLPWNENKAQLSAQEMFDRIFNMKFLPPGRGLWAMGSPITEERGLYAALNNCAFVSTEDIKDTLEEPFTFLMDMSMLGVGVGFDTKGAETITVHGYNPKAEFMVIPDTREGWVDATGKMIRNGFTGGPRMKFDYSEIRPAGLPIKGFGGYSSGPEPLIQLHERIEKIIDKTAGQQLSVETIVDLQNVIGACVVAGNVRRTAEIVFGDPGDEAYLNLKNYKWQKDKYVGPRADRADWGWTSNNSVFCGVGQDYERCGDATARNGEPGYAWLDNMQKYGRMADRHEVGLVGKDSRAKGGNPCLEQTLESFELCCLVETFPANHTSLEDYKRTLKFAYLYAKTVTLGKTHWTKTNQVMLRNRRIGCSQSGIQQFVARNGIETYRQWCEGGFQTIQKYDEIYSEWFCIPRSIKTTSIKPSGTVSLLVGATPGMHWPEDIHCIRRMRLAKNSDLVQPLIDAGYHVEPCVGQEDSTVVVEVPVKLDDEGGKLRAVKDVSMWEQVAMASLIQRWWADNQVSCTVTFDPTEGPQIKHALNYFQYDLKGISFLPRLEAGAYAQMPYESITADVFAERSARLKPIHFSGTIQGELANLEPGCEAGACVLPKKEG